MIDKVIEKINKAFESFGKELNTGTDKIQIAIKLGVDEGGQEILKYDLRENYVKKRDIDLWKDVLGFRTKFLDIIGVGDMAEMLIAKNFDKYAKQFQTTKDKLSFLMFKNEQTRNEVMVYVFVDGKAQIFKKNIEVDGNAAAVEYNCLPIEEFASMGINI